MWVLLSRNPVKDALKVCNISVIKSFQFVSRNRPDRQVEISHTCMLQITLLKYGIILFSQFGLCQQL